MKVIKKILNNNFVVCDTGNGKEIVAMGTGIGFQKKRGDKVSTSDITRTFVATESGVLNQMQTLFQEVPFEHVEVASEMIKFAEAALGITFHDTIYLTLTDHLHYAITRHKEGIELVAPLALEIQRLYPKEYEVAVNTIAIAKRRLGIEFSNYEAIFITLHFLNGQSITPNISDTMERNRIIHDVLNIISRHYGLVLDDTMINYTRLITHLNYFVTRLLTNEEDENVNDFLFDVVKNKYNEAYQCTLRINDYLGSRLYKPLSMAEQTYLMLHIQRVTS